MKTFREWLLLREKGDGLWMRGAPQDNPSNPGTKRKDAKHPYNHRFGGIGGAAPVGGGAATPTPQGPAQPQVAAKMKRD
jgi:hypothetical protein